MATRVEYAGLEKTLGVQRHVRPGMQAFGIYVLGSSVDDVRIGRDDW